MKTARPPAVAGAFYPSDPGVLAQTVDALLSEAQVHPRKARAIIAPHAGYVYSGPVAATAYQALDPGTRRVVILGPTHRVGIEGMALTGADFQRTPLGDVPTDKELEAKIASLPEVVTAPVVHAQEHSLEVHLPFLQRYLGEGFTAVPIAVGQASPEAVAAVIETAWETPDTAVIVSSDLSHFLPYEQARQVDAATLAQIVEGAPALTPDQACGAYPTSGMMHFARSRGLEAEILDARNSGDTEGDRNRVVGYPALAWHEADAEEEAAHLDLPRLAYNAIAEKLGVPTLGDGDAGPEENLGAPGATFVTLHLDGRLRGCIGSLEATRPLGEDVVANAVAAAFEDPRFPPLTAEELERVDLEVSELTEPVPMWEPGRAAFDEAGVLGRLRPGIDGVVLKFGARRATYLPQVWEQIHSPAEFMESLKAKAGLPPAFWHPQIQVETYQVRPHQLDREGK